MATYTKNSTASTFSGSGSKYVSHDLSNVNTDTSNNIPKYSTINSLVWKYYIMETTNKTGKADFYLFFGDADQNSIKQLYYGDGVIPKNGSEYLEVSTDLTGYVSSNSSSSGHISYSGATRFYARCQSSLISRTYSYYYSRIFTYTPPTYTISAKAGVGGTVSGGGTYDVAIADQTKTITATPNTGYKFVKWVDDSGNTYSTDATTTVTISQNNILTHSTTVTYTAVFEVDKMFIDTSKPSKILIDNDVVKAIYADTTKVYG